MYKDPSKHPLEGNKSAIKIIREDLKAYISLLDVIKLHTGMKGESIISTKMRVNYFLLVHEGYSGKAAKEILAEEFFCTVKTVEKHLYRLVIKKRRRGNKFSMAKSVVNM